MDGQLENIYCSQWFDRIMQSSSPMVSKDSEIESDRDRPQSKQNGIVGISFNIVFRNAFKMT